MRIGELSEKTGVSVRMLRYYEEQGLLEPRRTDSGYRMFSEVDVERVGTIRCMLAAGLPTVVAGHVLRWLCPDHPPIPDNEQECRPLIEILEQERTTLSDRIDQLTANRERLDGVLADVRRKLAERCAAALSA